VRVFLAVDVDEHVRLGIRALIDRLRELLDRRVAHHGRIGWVSADRVHVTLHFIGELPDTRVRELADTTMRPLDVTSFELGLGGLGVFPPRGRPRVLWVGIDRGADALTRVHEEMGKRLVALGLPLEAHAFSPHLTLARFREPGPLAVRSVIEGVDASEIGACPVTSVTLYQSRLGRGGATYTPLARGALRPCPS
jgi:RNA 2',3'-cyclic 3'-phosphodiesterase